MKRNLETVAQFASGRPFTEGQTRWWIFQADNNGMAEAEVVVRIGRRVYIDTDAFEQWIDSQNQRVSA